MQVTAAHLFQLSEEVLLECSLLSLLIPGEFCELSAAVRFHTRPRENALMDGAEDQIQGPWQYTSISIWTWSTENVPDSTSRDKLEPKVKRLSMYDPVYDVTRISEE